MVRKTTDGEESTHSVLTKAHVNWKPSPNALPEEIKPPRNGRFISLRKSESFALGYRVSKKQLTW